MRCVCVQGGNWRYLVLIWLAMEEFPARGNEITANQTCGIGELVAISLLKGYLYRVGGG